MSYSSSQAAESLMEFTVSEGSGPPAGIYKAEFLGVKKTEHDEYGLGARFDFKIVGGEHDGRITSRTCKPQPTAKNATGRLMAGLVGSATKPVHTFPSLSVPLPEASGSGIVLFCGVAATEAVAPGGRVRVAWITDRAPLSGSSPTSKLTAARSHRLCTHWPPTSCCPLLHPTIRLERSAHCLSAPPKVYERCSEKFPTRFAPTPLDTAAVSAPCVGVSTVLRLAAVVELSTETSSELPKSNNIGFVPGPR